MNPFDCDCFQKVLLLETGKTKLTVKEINDQYTSVSTRVRACTSTASDGQMGRKNIYTNELKLAKDALINKKLKKVRNIKKYEHNCARYNTILYDIKKILKSNFFSQSLGGSSSKRVANESTDSEHLSSKKQQAGRRKTARSVALAVRTQQGDSMQ